MLKQALDFVSTIKTSLKDTVFLSLKVFKVIIPITIIVKIISELGFIQYLAYPLEPIMSLVGLPAEYGIAWAAAMLVNLYSGLVVFMGILPEIGVPTIAEVSTLSFLALIAHSMFLESKIAQECGVSFWSQFVLRLVVAILGGIVLHFIYSITAWHSAPASILLEVSTDPSLYAWIMGELYNLVQIFCIIWLVLFLHLWLTRMHITDMMEKVLSPLLRLLGMSKAAASTIIVGFCAGLVYGSGLIIKHSHENKMSKKDLFCALSLMGLAHALVEDTILMMLIGGSPWVTLGFRFLVTLIVGVLISYLYDFFVKKQTLSQ